MAEASRRVRKESMAVNVEFDAIDKGVSQCDAASLRRAADRMKE